MTSRTLVTFPLTAYVLITWFMFCKQPDGLTRFVTLICSFSTCYVLGAWLYGSGYNITGMPGSDRNVMSKESAELTNRIGGYY
jgi:hypothetical protein